MDYETLQVMKSSADTSTRSTKTLLGGNFGSEAYSGDVPKIVLLAHPRPLVQFRWDCCDYRSL